LNQITKAYRIINLSLAGVIVLVLLYSSIFDYRKNNFPVHSFHDTITGQTSLSTGLSRSFSAIMRFDLDEARAFNGHGISVFMFLILQLFMRGFFYFNSKKEFYSIKQTITVDVVLSIALFVLFFRPFILDCFRF
jgi:hypothetical protein